jgi:hypothetical protein
MTPEEAATRLAPILHGDAEIGRDEPVFALLTVDTGGLPRSSALSRTELAVQGAGVHVALHARRATANLERDGRAVLVAFDGDAILSVGLQVEAAIRHDGLFAARLGITGGEADSLGIPLRPATFVPTAEVARMEHWDRTRAALARLAAES